ncbi:MAG TPA: proton-conducting transporter membrane subunit [Candidatus Dormibacteraeota bacterium]
MLTAASGAASGARSTGFTFDPASTLSWAVPLMVIAPLASFVLAISSIRTRRSSSNMAMIGAVVTLLATLLVGWGLAKKSLPFLATYQYINLPVAFSGPVNFQGFGIDIVLRVDHLTVAALVVIEICFIGAIGWHQVMGRSEPGAARFHALISALLFASVGVMVSWDLAELLAFWGIAGAMTYLLLAHRWGVDEAARRARVALALPFLTDLSLLCGVAWLYARYGVQNLNTLVPILHSNPGWTVRSLAVASVLLLIGVAGRLAIWPLQSWVTQTSVSAPPAALALAQSVWSVLAIVVLYRVMPIFAASNIQTLRACMYACAGAAVIAALLALLSNEPRRIIALLGSAVTATGAAIVIHGFEVPHAAFAIAGVACILAAAPARVAATLAASAISTAMRTDDLAEMGDAWRRMRASSLALLLAGVVIALCAWGALSFAVSSRSWLGALLGESVLLVAVGMARVFFGVSIGPLRRRRAFEPDRVREAHSSSLGWPYLLTLAGAAFLVASAIRGWLDLLDGLKHPEPGAGSFLLWVAIAVIGVAAASLAFVRDKDGAIRVSDGFGALLAARVAAAGAFVERFLVAPSADLARRIDMWLPAGDGALARFGDASGRLATTGGRLPVLPVIVVVAVVLALVVGLAAPGLVR